MSRLIVITILLLLTLGGATYLSKNHYLCGTDEGRLTREKETQARSLPKYPNAQKYVIEASCGGFDGKPNASIKFLTSDKKDKVTSFYHGHYVNYIDPKSESFTQYSNFKWWNVEIGF